MPRKKLIRQNKFPYHVTTRTNNKDWFCIPIYEVWDLCKESLIYAQKNRMTNIHCFVLMSNHYHLLLSTPNEDIDQFMMYFNAKLSRLISKRSGVVNHKFSNRYSWSIVDDRNYLINVYRYIYQNPVRAKVVDSCSSYPYSSLHFTRYEAKLLSYKPHFNYFDSKAWFEKRFGDEFEKTIRHALRRDYFRPKNNLSKYHQKILEDQRS